MKAFIIFQKQFIDPYLILQAVIDTENCREFWRMNQGLIISGVVILIVLGVLYVYSKKKKA
jgi:LPXTG-motif cell wall-anchored protein